MIDKTQLREMIDEITEYLGIQSEAGTNLLMGTAAQESKLGTYFKQIGGGPALGIFQMEPDTEEDIWENFLLYNGVMNSRIRDLVREVVELPLLKYNIAYQIAMARMQYYRHSETLPKADNVWQLATYWKKYYNTPLGAGTAQDFVDNFQRYALFEVLE